MPGLSHRRDERAAAGISDCAVATGRGGHREKWFFTQLSLAGIFIVPSVAIGWSMGRELLSSVLSASLLILFGGITDRLIPVFAVGAFAASCFFAGGNGRHWMRKRGRCYRA